MLEKEENKIDEDNIGKKKDALTDLMKNKDSGKKLQKDIENLINEKCNKLIIFIDL